MGVPLAQCNVQLRGSQAAKLKNDGQQHRTCLCFAVHFDLFIFEKREIEPAGGALYTYVLCASLVNAGLLVSTTPEATHLPTRGD